MTAPVAVDVLAALDALRKEWRDERLIISRLDSADVLDLLHAAVAELIEKLEELLSTHGVYHCYGGSGESIEGRMHAELTAALARCRGAQ